MFYKKLKSWAKINLSINVIKRLQNNYHSIESLITFIDIFDEIKIKTINENKHKVSFSGQFSKGIGKNNSIIALLKLLEKKKFLINKKFDIKVKKNIPQKSGMGGGSMNAASILKYFITKKILKISKKKVINLSNKVGSDVILGLEKKNSVLFKDGKVARLQKKLNFYVLVVMPNFGCSTKKIYSRINKFSKPLYLKANNQLFKTRNLIKSNNDLEKIVIRKHPKVKNLKDYLLVLPNVVFARMTGSGSAIVAYFKSKNSAKKAAKIFKKKYRSYWCILSKTI
tara:strand:- start:26 stop:874 length:849 start_codon:yes stop_codon:yes gene_type:complete